MNDSSLVAWIATHVRTFRVTATGADLEYLDDNGKYAIVKHTCPDPEKVTEEELLRECIQQAIGTIEISE